MDMWYVILVIPAIIFSLIAQASVKSTYAKYSRIMSRRGMTGSDVAAEILRRNGISEVGIQHINGKLTDNYNSEEKVIKLSDDVYDGSSVAALGIAAHEAGHTVQHYSGYTPIKVRNAILPAVNIGSALSMPLILIGFLFNFSALVNVGIVFFGLVVVFQLVTLPVEFNASARAIKSLEGCGILSDEELKMTGKVLRAAAMTYVAALAVTLAQFLRLILLSQRRNR